MVTIRVVEEFINLLQRLLEAVFTVLHLDVLHRHFNDHQQEVPHGHRFGLNILFLVIDIFLEQLVISQIGLFPLELLQARMNACARDRWEQLLLLSLLILFLAILVLVFLVLAFLFRGSKSFVETL